MTLISERATIMPQVSTSAGVSCKYPSQVFSPPLMAHDSLTLLVAKSTQVPKADGVAVGNEERGATGGSSLNIISCSSSTSSWLASIDLTQETLDKESREKLKGKIVT